MSDLCPAMRMLFVLTALLAVPVAAQSIAPAHQSALDAWQSEWASDATLAPAADFAFIDSYRQDAGDASFTPYYTTGDFDRDGYGDFAALVVDAPSDDPEAFRESYVLVFSGQGGGVFGLAHAGLVDPEGGDAYRGLMLTMDDEGYLTLVLAETDAGEQVFVPFRGGYAIYQAEGG